MTLSKCALFLSLVLVGCAGQRSEPSANTEPKQSELKEAGSAPAEEVTAKRDVKQESEKEAGSVSAEAAPAERAVVQNSGSQPQPRIQQSGRAKRAVEIPKQAGRADLSTREEADHDVSCQTDTDCVKADCCHAKSCVQRSKAPVCKGVMCTEVCMGGTLDCGGKCLCMDGKCKAKYADFLK